MPPQCRRLLPAASPPSPQVSTLLIAETEKPIVNLSFGQQSEVGKELAHAVIPAAIKVGRGAGGHALLPLVDDTGGLLCAVHWFRAQAAGPPALLAAANALRSAPPRPIGPPPGTGQEPAGPERRGVQGDGPLLDLLLPRPDREPVGGRRVLAPPPLWASSRHAAAEGRRRCGRRRLITPRAAPPGQPPRVCCCSRARPAGGILTVDDARNKVGRPRGQPQAVHPRAVWGSIQRAAWPPSSSAACCAALPPTLPPTACTLPALPI